MDGNPTTSEDEFPEFVVRALRAIAITSEAQEKELRHLKSKLASLEGRLSYDRTDTIIRNYKEATLFKQLAELRGPTDEESNFYVRTADGRICLQEDTSETLET